MAKTKEKEIDIDIEEMRKAGLYFGHRASVCHPRMKPYIIGVKGSDHINIIDLEKTAEKFKEALKFIQKLIKEKQVILFVGTRPGIQTLIKETAIECGFPYIENRWVGGTITNFKVIKKRVDYLKELEKKKKSGELKKYTKKERLGFDKEIHDLERKFGGIKTSEKLPDALFVVDFKREKLAVKEARMKEIPVIGVVDTNVDPTLADYPIPANDDAISSVKYVLEKVKEAILKVEKQKSTKLQAPNDK